MIPIKLWCNFLQSYQIGPTFRISFKICSIRFPIPLFSFHTLYVAILIPYSPTPNSFLSHCSFHYITSQSAWILEDFLPPGYTVLMIRNVQTWNNFRCHLKSRNGIIKCIVKRIFASKTAIINLHSAICSMIFFLSNKAVPVKPYIERLYRKYIDNPPDI